MQWGVNKSMRNSSGTIHSSLQKAGNFLCELIYPSVCLQCDADGDQGMDLCSRCHKNLPWIKYACEKCALPLQTDEAKICGYCSKRNYYFDCAIAPLEFEGFIREAIYHFKFNQKLNQGKVLAQLFLNYIERTKIDIPEVIIPVPLHKKRLQKRGFNQALEIARILSKNLGCELSYQSIYRNRNTSTQMELPAKARIKNVKGAFSLKEKISHLTNKHVCIVDDVMTTGNTVNEVAKCLQKANVEKIDVWCIARVS